MQPKQCPPGVWASSGTPYQLGGRGQWHFSLLVPMQFQWLYPANKPLPSCCLDCGSGLYSPYFPSPFLFLTFALCSYVACGKNLSFGNWAVGGFVWPHQPPVPWKKVVFCSVSCKGRLLVFCGCQSIRTCFLAGELRLVGLGVRMDWVRPPPLVHSLRKIQLVPVLGTFLFPFASHIWGKKRKNNSL